MVAINKRLDREFGGNRESTILRDGEKCVLCGMTREDHRARFAKDITVDHIDGQGTGLPVPLRNNDPSNLQTLCIPCHSRKDGIRRGTTKLTINDVVNIRHMYGSTTAAELSRLYGVTKVTIYSIWRGDAWTEYLPKSIKPLKKPIRFKKLTDEQALHIMSLKGTMYGHEAAKIYGIHASSVLQIWRGNGFKHLRAQLTNPKQQEPKTNE